MTRNERTPRRTRPGTRRAEGMRAKRNKRKLTTIAVVLGVVLVTAAAAGAWYYNNLSNRLAADETTAAEVAAVLEPQTADVESGARPAYILLLGSDARPGQGRSRSDSVVIARFDKKSKRVSLLSIPRDTRVAVPGHGYTKLAHANAYGGPALAITTVKNYTGLPIDHYVEMNFAGFARMVDALGGVRIDVDVTIDDKHGANTGGVSNVTYIRKGEQVLNGAQALTYVRARHIAGGDGARMKHQQVFLKALATQALASGNRSHLPGVINAAADNIETDLKVPAILAIAKDFQGFKGDSIKTYNAKGKGGKIGGVYYIIPDVVKSQALFRSFENGVAK